MENETSSSPIDKLAYYFSEKNRVKKFKDFLDFFTPNEKDTIIDIGVNDEEYSESDNYLEKHYSFRNQITAVSKDGLDRFHQHYPNIRVVKADGLALPFQDNEFSISYSNAVIEHVGTRENQLTFLKELFRVGKGGFLTTPNRLFPIEIHTRVLLLHLFLSKSKFDSFLRKIGKKWATGNYMNLLSEHDLRALLSEADIRNYRFKKNKFLGIPITFSVMWKKNP